MAFFARYEEHFCLTYTLFRARQGAVQGKEVDVYQNQETDFQIVVAGSLDQSQATCTGAQWNVKDFISPMQHVVVMDSYRHEGLSGGGRGRVVPPLSILTWEIVQYRAPGDQKVLSSCHVTSYQTSPFASRVISERIESLVIDGEVQLPFNKVSSGKKWLLTEFEKSLSFQASSSTRGFSYDLGTWFMEELDGKKSLVIKVESIWFNISLIHMPFSILVMCR